MFRALVFVTICLATVWAKPDEDMRKCKRLMHPESMHCCVRDSQMKPPMEPPEGIKECMQLSRKPPSCDREICFAIKHGYASSDGKIDKAALKEKIAKDFENSPELAKAIEENCIDGDISSYGMPDMCEVMKVRHCVDIQLLKTCPEWNNEGPCNGIKDLAEECVKIISP